MEQDKQIIYERSRKYYDRNVQRYQTSSWHLINKYKDICVNEELGFCLKSIKNQVIDVLEIGPGPGYLTQKLPRLCSKEIRYMAIEHSGEMVKALNSNKDGFHSFEVVNASVSEEFIQQMPDSQKFDLIIGSSILHHLPDYEQVVDLLAQKLKNKGIMYIVREPIHKLDCHSSNIVKDLFDLLYNSITKILLRPRIRKLLWPQKTQGEYLKNLAVVYDVGVKFEPFKKLSESDYKLIIYRKYNRRASSFMSFVENKWFKFTRKDIFGNTLFSVGIQRIIYPSSDKE